MAGNFISKINTMHSRLERMIYSESASDCIALEIKGDLQQKAESFVMMEAETDSVTLDCRIIYAFPA